MNATSTEPDEAPAIGLRGLAALFLGSAVVFFPLIMNPLVFDFFDAENDAERLVHVEENHTVLRLIFSGIGVTEAVLGVALWLWGRHVAARTPGRRGWIAGTFGRVALAAGILGLLLRLLTWIEDEESLASGDLDALDIVFGVVYGGGLSLTFLVFGYLMIRSAMPTWLGVVWILCGVMFWVGILPLWFFVGGLVFGIRGLISFRPGSPALERISAEQVQPVASSAMSVPEVRR